MKYELSFIISPAIAETDQAAVNQEVLGYLKDLNVKITREPYFMGRRRLAYPIAKQKHGFYVCLEFEAEDVSVLKEVDTKLKHNNSLLRYLIIKLDNRSESKTVDFSKMEERTPIKSNSQPARRVKISLPKVFSRKEEPKKDNDKGKINLEDIDKKLDAILEEPKLD